LLTRAFTRSFSHAYFAPSRSPVSRHGDQGFRAIAINRFGIAITDFGDGDQIRPGAQAR